MKNKFKKVFTKYTKEYIIMKGETSMSEEFVTRTEFDNLKNEVYEIKQEVAESSKLLSTIDKKIDVINEKIVTADKIDELKFAPLNQKIETLQEKLKTLEEKQTWLKRALFTTIGGAITSIVIGAIVYVIKQM